MHFEDDYDFGHDNQGPYANTPGSFVNTDINPDDALHDAAFNHLGGLWHLPTVSDFEELIAHTSHIWIDDYNQTGVSGYKFVSLVNPDVYIFLPAAGRGIGTTVDSRGSSGHYWGSTIDETIQSISHALVFDSDTVNPDNESYRYRGYTIRAVC